MSFTDKLTHDGFDYTFATNAMGHWLLTESLMPALLAASTPTQRSRVITVSSRVCYGLPLNFDVFMDGPVRKNTKGSRCYQQSKLVRTPEVPCLSNH